MSYRAHALRAMLAIGFTSQLAVLPAWLLIHQQTQHPSALLVVLSLVALNGAYVIAWVLYWRGSLGGGINLFIAASIAATLVMTAVMPDAIHFTSQIVLVGLLFASVAFRNGVSESIWLSGTIAGYVISALLRPGAKIDLEIAAAVHTLLLITVPPFAFVLVVLLSRLMTGALRAALAEVRDLDLARHRILTTLNHEFRTPLTYIIGYAMLLRDAGESERASMVQKLVAGSDRLKTLIEGFLTLAALSYSEARQAFERHQTPFVAWDNLIDKVVEIARARWTEKKITVKIHVDKHLPPIVGYDLYLDIILTQLVDNAIKFTAEGGQIYIGVMPARDKGVMLLVQDTGVGIEERDLSSIFTAFRQIDRHVHEQQGAGIGLALVKGLVELHGGHVEVESRPDKGSRFKAFFPGMA